MWLIHYVLGLVGGNIFLQVVIEEFTFRQSQSTLFIRYTITIIEYFLHGYITANVVNLWMCVAIFVWMKCSFILVRQIWLPSLEVISLTSKDTIAIVCIQIMSIGCCASNTNQRIFFREHWLQMFQKFLFFENCIINFWAIHWYICIHSLTNVTNRTRLPFIKSIKSSLSCIFTHYDGYEITELKFLKLKELFQIRKMLFSLSKKLKKAQH